MANSLKMSDLWDLVPAGRDVEDAAVPDDRGVSQVAAHQVAHLGGGRGVRSESGGRRVR